MGLSEGNSVAVSDAFRPRDVAKQEGDSMLSIQRADDLASEIAKSNVTYVDKEASVLAASKLMRASGATQLLVTEITDGVFVAIGIVTAGDIVTRVVATGLDPAVLTAGDITWWGSHGRT
jgi:CBS domain-containing protein